MPVLGEDVPANRVGPTWKALERDADRLSMGAGRPGQSLAELVLDLDRVRLRLDRLIEVQNDRPRRRLEPLLIRRRRRVEIRVRESRRRKRKRRNNPHKYSRAKRRDKPAPRKMRSIFRGDHR